MTQNGKGDSPRPKTISNKEWDKNWQLIFGKQSVPKCNYCGKFAKKHVFHQPHTEQYKLEPAEPILLCLQCNDQLKVKNAK